MVSYKIDSWLFLSKKINKLIRLANCSTLPPYRHHRINSIFRRCVKKRSYFAEWCRIMRNVFQKTSNFTRSISNLLTMFTGTVSARGRGRGVYLKGLQLLAPVVFLCFFCLFPYSIFPRSCELNSGNQSTSVPMLTSFIRVAVKNFNWIWLWIDFLSPCNSPCFALYIVTFHGGFYARQPLNYNRNLWAWANSCTRNELR